MNNELKMAYNKLSVNDKRNQLSDELILIGELLKKIEDKFGINSEFNIKNYDINKDKQLTENEMLLFIYEDIFKIQRELITILTAINITDDENL